MKHFLSLLFCVALLFCHLTASAQNNGADSASVASPDSSAVSWTRNGSLNFNFTNVGLSNWAAGGNSAVSLGSLLAYSVNRKGKKSDWNTNLKFAYGLVRVDGGIFQKTDDLLTVQSKYVRNFTKNFRLIGLLDFSTQMANGYTFVEDPVLGRVENKISAFMAPGYMMTGMGLNYEKSKTTFLTFKPIALKSTFVMDDSLALLGAYGVEPGKNYRAEGGVYIIGAFQKEVVKNVNFQTRFGLFMNYWTMPNTDINWETVTIFKINKYMNASFTTHLIYDKDIDLQKDDGTTGPAVQFKHVLNLGIGFKF